MSKPWSTTKKWVVTGAVFGGAVGTITVPVLGTIGGAFVGAIWFWILRGCWALFCKIAS